MRPQREQKTTGNDVGDELELIRSGGHSAEAIKDNVGKKASGCSLELSSGEWEREGGLSVAFGPARMVRVRVAYC